MGKKQKYKNESIMRMDLASLKEKVYIKILETCDDPRIMSEDMLV
jgi:hypothetical protein